MFTQSTSKRTIREETLHGVRGFLSSGQDSPNCILVMDLNGVMTAHCNAVFFLLDFGAEKLSRQRHGVRTCGDFMLCFFCLVSDERAVIVVPKQNVWSLDEGLAMGSACACTHRLSVTAHSGLYYGPHLTARSGHLPFPCSLGSGKHSKDSNLSIRL